MPGPFEWIGGNRSPVVSDRLVLLQCVFQVDTDPVAPQPCSGFQQGVGLCCASRNQHISELCLIICQAGQSLSRADFKQGQSVIRTEMIERRAKLDRGSKLFGPIDGIHGFGICEDFAGEAGYYFDLRRIDLFSV